MATRPALVPEPEGRADVPARPLRVLRFADGEGSGSSSDASRLAVLGVGIALVPVFMLFLAFASAYIVRQGLGSDWMPVALPAVVWLNTLVLVASSLALERGRRGEDRPAWIWLSVVLGWGFLAGQVVAWLELARRGIGLGSTAYGSFFYVFTGVHGAHLGIGLIGLMAAALWPRSGWLETPRPGALRAASLYWHFMGLLWIGILCLFTIGR